MEFDVELDREEDGRWFAAVDSLHGVMAYGATRYKAQAKVEALARDVVLKGHDFSRATKAAKPTGL